MKKMSGNTDYFEGWLDYRKALYALARSADSMQRRLGEAMMIISAILLQRIPSNLQDAHKALVGSVSTQTDVNVGRIGASIAEMSDEACVGVVKQLIELEEELRAASWED
jgi:hypothetical protein